jgi:hypothetical protein
MATKISRTVRRRLAEVLVKIAISLVGMFAIAWGGWLLPVFKAEASPRFVAGRILQGDSYKMPTLLLTAQQAVAVAARYSFCNPAALHNLTAIRLGIFRNTVGGNDSALFQSSYDALYTIARQTLTCAPDDSFVWLTLFWADVVGHGLTGDNERYLRMSYASAPNEAWIAQWRTHLTFALFDQLPEDLAARSVEDFVNLLQTKQVYWDMAKVFDNTSAEGQHRIAESLQTTDPTVHQAFIEVLHSKGFDIDVPNAVTSEPRP